MSNRRYKTVVTNKSKTVQTNTPGWSAPPDTADVSALRNQAQTAYDYATPLRNQYARAEQNLSNSYQNPLGGFQSGTVRDAALRSQKKDMGQSLGMALSDAGQQSNQAKFGQMATVAGMTAPKMYMQRSQNSQPFVGGDVVEMAASAAMM